MLNVMIGADNASELRFQTLRNKAFYANASGRQTSMSKGAFSLRSNT